MKLKDYLKFKKVIQLRLARETGLNATKLSMFLNSWIELEDYELKKISDYLGISMSEIKSNNIKDRK